jgi:hypothetical protein
VEPGAVESSMTGKDPVKTASSEGGSYVLRRGPSGVLSSIGSSVIASRIGP